MENENCPAEDTVEDLLHSENLNSHTCLDTCSTSERVRHKRVAKKAVCYVLSSDESIDEVSTEKNSNSSNKLNASSNSLVGAGDKEYSVSVDSSNGDVQLDIQQYDKQRRKGASSSLCDFNEDRRPISICSSASTTRTTKLSQTEKVKPKTKTKKQNTTHCDSEHQSSDEDEDSLIELNRTGHEFNYKDLKLKKDHKIRPIWICPDGVLILEAFSRFYKEAYDFLVAVAEPISRPKFVHEYRLSSYSLFSAVSIGLSPEAILATLDKLSKVSIPEEVKQFVFKRSNNFGKARLILKFNRMMIESPEKSTLEYLLKDNTIRNARITNNSASIEGNLNEFERAQAAMNDQTNLDRLTNIEICEEEVNDIFVNESDTAYLLDRSDPAVQSLEASPNSVTIPSTPSIDSQTVANKSENQESNTDKNYVYTFEISPVSVEKVRKAALDIEYPLYTEYDYINDSINPSLSIMLKPNTEIRPYQEHSLTKMFSNGRARSGIVVLPCGAGKTLTGIAACCTIKKSCIVLCTGGVACEQWKRQFEHFTTLPPSCMYVFTSKEKNEISRSKPCVLITTYSMMAAAPNRRSAYTANVLSTIGSIEWGLMILDEVHVTPARLFRKVLTNIRAHCKLGLTGTLVREDELIHDLNFLIGPKLYEANWLDLTDAGYLARVQCQEVRCPMSEEFYLEYLHEPGLHIRKLLCTLNPNKCFAADFLTRQHEILGHRVLIFCDNLVAVKFLAELLNRPCITGDTPHRERLVKFNQFRMSSVVSTLILTKVGDVAIDLPEANVIIQVSSHFGSRRQEAQRLGRILRPNPDQPASDFSIDCGSPNAFFYTLVSSNTEETRFSAKRQQYLVNQGYNYRVVMDTCDVAKAQLLSSKSNPTQIVALLSLSTQLRLLQKVMVLSTAATEDENGSELLEDAPKTREVSSDSDLDTAGDSTADEGGSNDSASGRKKDYTFEAYRKIKRQKSTIDFLTGAGNLHYVEHEETM